MTAYHATTPGEDFAKGGLTRERLRQVLRFDPEEGRFYWLVNTRRAKAGDMAGGFTSDGYRKIAVFGASYKEHRLVWLYVTGAWPAEEIDHINGNRSDNRVSNLRPASRAENRQNSKLQKNNASGCAGVVWNKENSKWEARIEINNRRIYLGLFADKADAIAARLEGKRKFHSFSQVQRAIAE